MHVPESNQRAEERVRAVFDGFAPWGGEERGRFRVEGEKGKLGVEQSLEEMLEAAKFMATVCDRAFFIFDDARKPKKSDHRRVWVNLGGEARRGTMPTGDKAQVGREAREHAWRAGALRDVSGVAGGVFAVKERMGKPIHRACARRIGAHNGRVDSSKGRFVGL